MKPTRATATLWPMLLPKTCRGEVSFFVFLLLYVSVSGKLGPMIMTIMISGCKTGSYSHRAVRAKVAS